MKVCWQLPEEVAQRLGLTVHPDGDYWLTSIEFVGRMSQTYDLPVNDIGQEERFVRLHLAGTTAARALLVRPDAAEMLAASLDHGLPLDLEVDEEHNPVGPGREFVPLVDVLGEDAPRSEPEQLAWLRALLMLCFYARRTIPPRDSLAGWAGGLIPADLRAIGRLPTPGQPAPAYPGDQRGWLVFAALDLYMAYLHPEPLQALVAADLRASSELDEVLFLGE